MLIKKFRDKITKNPNMYPGNFEQNRAKLANGDFQLKTVTKILMLIHFFFFIVITHRK